MFPTDVSLGAATGDRPLHFLRRPARRRPSEATRPAAHLMAAATSLCRLHLESRRVG
jgi:hypothetical protein